MANARSADDSTGSRALAADAQTAMIAEGRRARDPAGRISRPERTSHDGLVDALTMLSGRCLALKARNRELAREVEQLRTERRRLRSRMAAVSISQPMQKTRLAQSRAASAREDERRRLDRDLHDGVQNELVALILKLSLAEQEPDTSPSLAVILAELGLAPRRHSTQCARLPAGSSLGCSRTSVPPKRCVRRRRAHRCL